MNESMLSRSLKIFGDNTCHPERSEGSGSPAAQNLRCAQDSAEFLIVRSSTGQGVQRSLIDHDQSDDDGEKSAPSEDQNHAPNRETFRTGVAVARPLYQRRERSKPAAIALPPTHSRTQSRICPHLVEDPATCGNTSSTRSSCESSMVCHRCPCFPNEHAERRDVETPRTFLSPSTLKKLERSSETTPKKLCHRRSHAALPLALFLSHRSACLLVSSKDRMPRSHPEAGGRGETAFAQPAYLFTKWRWMIDGIRIRRSIVMDEVIPFHLTELLVPAQIPTLGQALLTYHFIILASKELGDPLGRRLNEISEQESSSCFQTLCYLDEELALLRASEMVNTK